MEGKSENLRKDIDPEVRKKASDMGVVRINYRGKISKESLLHDLDYIQKHKIDPSRPDDTTSTGKLNKP